MLQIITLLKNILFLSLLSSLFFGFSQKKILIYHETSGFRHSSINSGIAMFEDLGDENSEWTTDNSRNSSVFTTSNLSQYDAVVFLNTSGDGLLSTTEKEALEGFIANGKGFIGIHAATDTYRDKSWPFYNELVGAIVQTSPNHTANNYNADMEVITSNTLTDFLGSVGSIWNKNEEYYYWERNGGQLSTDNTVLLEVEQTGPQSYDAKRPTTWFKESITYDHDNDAGTAAVNLSGFRSFYTALGHNSSDFTSNSNFRSLLKNATLWVIGNTTLNSKEIVKHNNDIKVLTNPVQDELKIFFPISDLTTSINIYNVLGNNILNITVKPSILNSNIYKLNVKNYKCGVYILSISNKNIQKTFRIVKHK